MARPSKCRICGYRFKQGEDICPECFTARDDDITCEQFSHDEHTHSGGFSTTESSDVYTEFKESSFLDEQLKNENSNPIPDKTYGGKFGTPPPTYSQQTYKQESSTKNDAAARYAQNLNERMARLNAIRNGTFQPNNPRSATQQGYGNGNQFYTVRSTQARKRNNGIITVVVLIFIISFFLPVVIGIVTAMNASSSNKNASTKKPLESFNYEFSKPDISIPDFKSKEFTTDDFTVRVSKVKLYKEFPAAEGTELLGNIIHDTYLPVDDKYADTCRYMTITVTFDNPGADYDVDWEAIAVQAKDIMGSFLTNSIPADITRTDDNRFELGFYTAANVNNFDVYVPVISIDTEEVVMAELSLNIVNLTEVKDSYGTEELDAAFPDEGFSYSDDTEAVDTII